MGSRSARAVTICSSLLGSARNGDAAEPLQPSDGTRQNVLNAAVETVHEGDGRDVRIN